MALLHYQNLVGLHRPDIVLKLTFEGMKPFNDYLQQTEGYLKSEDAVMRLAWEAGLPPEENGNGNSDSENKEQDTDGFWIQLKEPDDRPNEPESTFMAFLDENTSEVYETAPPPRGESNRRRHRFNFYQNQRISVLDREPETNQLKLEAEPRQAELLIRPNTWPVQCQIRAIRSLRDAPSSDHRPLLRLFESTDHAKWPSVDIHEYQWGFEMQSSVEWTMLTDASRPGTDEQRRFVELALKTPDFAFLEGPPGSGKTTAICELILQLVRQDKRILLCASTHVAVDNVLERLTDEQNQHVDLIIPIRIGDRKNISEKAKPYQFERFVKTERKRLLRFLSGQKNRSKSQQALYELLQHGESNIGIERMVLDAANLVCGTTIGILQHPDIKKQNGTANPQFDVMIIDEASKTTFQEFLVPALQAKRWVIVGDPRQLSPYVDDEAMAVNIQATLPDEDHRNACIDVFRASHDHPKKHRAVVIATEKTKIKETYLAQAKGQGVHAVDLDTETDEIWQASVLVGSPENIVAKADMLPLDLSVVRGESPELDQIRRRVSAWRKLNKTEYEETPNWENEIGWRQARRYEQRFSSENGTETPTTANRLDSEIEKLLLAEDDKVRQDIDQVRRVALPSVLESLRFGFERNEKQYRGTALSDGLPENVLQRRHVLLSHQHRMHPKISAFSREFIYDGNALCDPPDMAEKCQWSYGRYRHRAIWLDVRGKFNPRFNKNSEEAEKIIGELKPFCEWAKNNPHTDGRPWEVAILTFYRGQEREIRYHLRKFTRQHRNFRYFRPNANVSVELCTVDRFQGHEADLVFISFARPHATSFLESPNRLNVAITRARYQRVIVGNRERMNKARQGILKSLAETENWEHNFGGNEHGNQT